jgi:hypothetical protein
MKMVTDSTKQNFWLYGFVQDGGDQTILAKSNSDLTFDWSSGISETPYTGTFTVTPDGENLFFSPIKTGYNIYWINATDGSVLGRMRYTLAAIYNYKLYAHPDSYAVYFELFDTNSMICKWIPGGTSIEWYSIGSPNSIQAVIPMNSEYMFIVTPNGDESTYYLRKIDYFNSAMHLWVKKIDWPIASCSQSQGDAAYYDNGGNPLLVLMTAIDGRLQFYVLNATNGNPIGTSLISTFSTSNPVNRVAVANRRAYFLYKNPIVSA